MVGCLVFFSFSCLALFSFALGAVPLTLVVARPEVAGRPTRGKGWMGESRRNWAEAEGAVAVVVVVVVVVVLDETACNTKGVIRDA